MDTWPRCSCNVVTCPALVLTNLEEGDALEEEEEPGGDPPVGEHGHWPALFVTNLEEGDALEEEEKPGVDPPVGQHGQLPQAGDDPHVQLLAAAAAPGSLSVLLQDILTQDSNQQTTHRD